MASEPMQTHDVLYLRRLLDEQIKIVDVLRYRILARNPDPSVNIPLPEGTPPEIAVPLQSFERDIIEVFDRHRGDLHAALMQAYKL